MLFEFNITSSSTQVQLRTEELLTPSSTRPGSNSSPPDHDSTFHVTKTHAVATRPSVTLAHIKLLLYIFNCNKMYCSISYWDPELNGCTVIKESVFASVCG